MSTCVRVIDVADIAYTTYLYRIYRIDRTPYTVRSRPWIDSSSHYKSSYHMNRGSRIMQSKVITKSTTLSCLIVRVREDLVPGKGC